MGDWVTPTTAPQFTEAELRWIAAYVPAPAHAEMVSVQDDESACFTVWHKLREHLGTDAVVQQH